MKTPTLMIQGTASSAGKSLLVTALCRIFSRKGIVTAPFKAQNMSLNSYITEEGHEIGRAQAVQAEAAGLAPSALMNPVLLKPSSDHRSQVIVNGALRFTLNARDYYHYRASLRPEVMAAFTRLAQSADLIILEGAGSPAEINLRENDLANMGMAAMANAPVLLVADIDRGGVFASLYGTVALLEAEEQQRVKGFVINKFRGERAILDPGITRMEELLSRPCLGVLPYMDVRIDEEDSLTETLKPARPGAVSADLDIAVIRLPRLSNFTDVAPLQSQPDVELRYVSAPTALGNPDLILLPGSKNTMADMDFLCTAGLAQAILALHARGIPILGICGGYQMLGRVIRDPDKAESPVSERQGLGLLPLETIFTPRKITAKRRMRLSANKGLFQGTQGLELEGYEIHMGESRPLQPLDPVGRMDTGLPDGATDAEGWTAGAYLHGLFDNLTFTRKLLNNLRRRKGLAALPEEEGNYKSFRQKEYDRLADMVESHMDMRAVEEIIDGSR